MNSAIFWRVVWKEYRQQRALWCAIVAAGVIMQVGVLLYAMLNDWRDLTNGLFTVALSVPVLYSLGCGAAMFAGEHETETFEFQKSLPVSAIRIFVGKFAFAAVSVLALFPLLWCVALALANWQLPDQRWHQQLWIGGTVAAAEVLVWAALGSLVLRRVLPAVVASGLIAVVLGYSSFVLVMVFGDIFQQQVNDYFSTLPLRSLCALVALAITCKLGLHWFDENLSLFPIQQPQAGKTAGRSTPIATSTNLSVMRRLVWHEWRQSRGTVFWLVVGYCALVVCFFQPGSQGPQWEVMLVLLPFLATAAGASMFWSDQQGQRFHFFTEHGVRPRLVWLSRQLVWGSVPTLAAAAACLPLAFGWPDDQELPAYALGLAILLFAAGQTCSMFIPSGIVSIFSAVFCGVVLFGWALFLTTMRVWWVVALLPLPFIFFWATWLYAPKWIQQRRSWRVRIATAASVIVPCLAVVAAAAAYRVYEIPAIELSFDATAAGSMSPVPPEKLETAAMYREASSSAQQKVVYTESGEVGVEEPDSQWQRAIALFVEASRRESCHFRNWSDLSTEEFYDSRSLASAVVAEARRLRAQGDLSGAAELYKALLRFAAHDYQQPSSHLYISYGQAVEGMVWEELLEWATHPDQQQEAVLEMLQQLQDFAAANQPNWEQGTLEQYALVRRFIELDDARFSEYYGNNSAERRLLTLVWRLMPWERARTARLLDLYTESQLRWIEEEKALPPARVWPRPADATTDVVLTRPGGGRTVVSELELTAWLQTTPSFVQITGFGYSYRRTTDRAEMYRRAAQVQLGLIAWLMEHGELPNTLEELVGHGLRTLPVDPYTGQPFVYVRQGAEQQVWDDEASSMMGMDEGGVGADEMAAAMPQPGEPRLVRTAPFIWSPVEQLYYVPPTSRAPSESPVVSDFRIDKGRKVMSSGRVLMSPLGRQLTSEIQLLRHGMHFLVPRQIDSLPRDEPSDE